MTERKTPKQLAIESGLPNLAVVSELTGISLRTLDKWCHERPKLFKVILAGSVAFHKNNQIN